MSGKGKKKKNNLKKDILPKGKKGVRNSGKTIPEKTTPKKKKSKKSSKFFEQGAKYNLVQKTIATWRRNVKEQAEVDPLQIGGASLEMSYAWVLADIWGKVKKGRVSKKRINKYVTQKLYKEYSGNIPSPFLIDSDEVQISDESYIRSDEGINFYDFENTVTQGVKINDLPIIVDFRETGASDGLYRFDDKADALHNADEIHSEGRRLADDLKSYLLFYFYTPKDKKNGNYYFQAVSSDGSSYKKDAKTSPFAKPEETDKLPKKTTIKDESVDKDIRLKELEIEKIKALGSIEDKFDRGRDKLKEDFKDGIYSKDEYKAEIEALKSRLGIK